MASTSLDLSQIKTDALSAASTFRTLIGLGNVNDTSDANKPISSATQSALNAKLSLTGGTLTGGLYFSGAAGARLEMSSQQYTPSNVAINMPWGSGTVQGIYGSAGLVGFASAGFSYFEVNTSGLRLASTRSIAMGGTIASPEVFAFSGGSNVWEQRNSTNAQTFRLYGTYTDASNYRRLYLSSTTAGAFTIGVEGAGTGADGNTLNIAGNTGIGTSSPNVALVIRRAGADLPALRLEDGDITVPFTGIGINPTLNANTVGSWSSSASASGGMSFSGFTNNTAASFPLVFEGYTGSASPTKSIISFSGWKTNGGTGATTLASSELIAGFFNGDVSGTPVVSIAANGATAFSGKITATATGNNSGGIGNGDNGVDFFQGVIIYNGQGGTSTAAYPAYFCFGQSTSKLKFHPNTELQWDAGDPTATRNNGDLRIARDAANAWAQRNGTNTQFFRIYNTYTDASNYIRQSLSFTTYSSTVHAQLVAEGAGTGAVNVPFVITPRGTGAFILGPMPDGTATGGNARGANAVDLQTSRSTATQVASGTGAFIGGGARNTVSSNYGAAFGFGCIVSTGNEGNLAGGYESTASGGQSSLAWGNRCTASGSESSWVIGYESSSTANASIAMGRNARSDRAYQYSHAAGPFSTAGDAQYTRFVLKNRTTDATPTILFGGVLPSLLTRLTIPSGKLFLFTAKIVGVRSDGLRRASYVRKGTIINVAGATSIVGAIEAVGTDVEDDPNLNITITADDTNDALDIQVTGITGETWRWVAVVEGVEVAYGT